MSDFEVNYRYLDEGGKRNITVRHKSGIKVTSPDYFESEMSDKELKSKVWEILKIAIKLFEQ